MASVIDGCPSHWQVTIACPHFRLRIPAMSQPPSSDNNGSRLLGLELLRFAAAFAVLMWHYKHFAYVGAAPPATFTTTVQPFNQLFFPFYEAGYLGVQVFWALSGYIFFWKYRKPLSSGLVSGWSFFVLRFSRLYPLHFVTLLLVAALQWVYLRQHAYYFVYQDNTWPLFVAQLFLASNWSPSWPASFNGPIWSISLEVLVYIVFFWTSRLLGSSWKPVILAIAFWLGSRLLGWYPDFIQCVLYFYLGGAVAIFTDGQLFQRFKGPIKLVTWALLFIAPMLVFGLGLQKSKYVQMLGLMLYIPTLLLAMVEYIRLPAWGANWVATAGNMTYASYLIHVPLQLSIAIVCAQMGVAVPMYSTVFFLIYVVAVFLLAQLVYVHFEMPQQSRIRKLLLRTG
jgi:peptidoglycan/LPS O-acetylase OafA/YrhL